MTLTSNPNDGWQNVPAPLREGLEAKLEPGEPILAWFLTDLDARMHYAEGLLVLTPRRVLSAQPGLERADEPGRTLTVEAWSLGDVESLSSRQNGSVGMLALWGPAGQLARWHYTAARASAVRRFSDRLAELKRGEPAPVHAPSISGRPVCPRCGEPMATDQAECRACSSEPVHAPTRSLVRLLRFARPYAARIAVGFLLALAATVSGLIPPYLTMPLLDKVLIPYQNGAEVQFVTVLWYLSGLFGASLIAWTLGWGRTFVLASVAERVSADLRNQAYAHLQRLSLEFFGGKRTGDLIARVGTETDRICFFLSVNLLDFAGDVLMIVLTAAILVSIDPLLALITLLPLPLIVWLVQRVRARLKQAFQRSGRAWGDLTSVLADTIPGIRVVKAFAQERREEERFRRANQRVLAANDRVNVIWSFFGPIVVLLTDVGLLVVWVFGAWRVFEHHITVGVLTAFVAYIGRFYTRLDSMSRMVAAAQKAGASTQRILEILDRRPSVADPPRPARLVSPRGDLELRGVGFQYGNRVVLRDINLAIRSGEMIGVVGPSGAGKTTLVNLVCRFYDPTEGAVFLDGKDIRSFALADYRRHVGIVLQEPFLFYGTIAENIAYGRPDASRDQIIAAAKAARAHEFILRLPDGYDSIVGERGQGLSGGERQRISIARAILIDPRILILDEATSSVDTETEREIQLALENLVRGRTTIAIAHRLSTLRRADRLIVLEQGQITEAGRHEALLENPGTYARLYRAQWESNLGTAIAQGKV